MISHTSQTQSFGQTMFRLAEKNPNLYVVSMDLASSLKLLDFKSKYPKRFIEVGVAEANAAGIAAGLAKAGKTVVLATFSCFSPGQNFNTIKQSICYNQANVILIGSHSGLMSTDLGATHQMLQDVALASILPGLSVYAPLDATETEKIITFAVSKPHPCYIRLTRGDSPKLFPVSKNFQPSHSHILSPGSKITLLGYGPVLSQYVDLFNQHPLWHGLLEVINISSIKPLDQKTILNSVDKTNNLIVLEDHQKIGGLGQMISAILLENNLHPAFIHLAVKDSFGQSGHDCSQLWSEYGLGQRDLEKAVLTLLRQSSQP